MYAYKALIHPLLTNSSFGNSTQEHITCLIKDTIMVGRDKRKHSIGLLPDPSAAGNKDHMSWTWTHSNHIVYKEIKWRAYITLEAPLLTETPPELSNWDRV